MEVYFKDLISEDASLEKLVDDLSMVVQGADDYAKAVGNQISEQARSEITGKLNNLKENYRRIRHQAMRGARATDKMLRANPYPSLAIMFALGLFAGARWIRRK